MKLIPTCALSVLLMSGCAEGLYPEVSVSPLVPSVLEVRWDRATDGQAMVTFGEDLRRVAWEVSEPGDDEVRVLVVGGMPGEELLLQATEMDGDVILTSAPQRVTTGLLLDAPPPLEVSEWAPEADDGRLLLTTSMGASSGPMLIDRAGSVLWFYSLPEGRMVIDAQLDEGGEGIWLLTMTAEFEGLWEGRLMRLGWDGAIEVDLALPNAHHAFTQLGDGRIAVVREMDTPNDNGDPSWNTDVLAVSEDGAQEVLADLYSISPGSMALGEGGAHSNGLTYVESRDSLLWSFGALGAVVEVEAQGGAKVWGVGDIDDAMPWGSPETAPTLLHSPSITPEGELMIFDNGAADRGARAVRFDLDGARGEVHESWEYAWWGDDQIFTLGHVRVLEDEHLLVSWGQRGQLEELNASGERIWLVSALAGSALGNVQRLDGLHP